ncbi:MAG: cobalamin biosynthesis protein CbiM [Microbacterium sp. 67-17]|uniref:energy-coupling factor ABC transporter permease n=1 Tax=Microbacterium sp. 67-17 TaxID=1895782 RepID=UPI00095A0888|nr:energy-coupling factor ABC transporter permease [Microbacterium sp. 67-17]OJV97253.1 MAG: cobalamin biosynthesis protein CbiM [Microbacterium sp. 67-17]
MHVPDGFLSVPVSIATGVVAAGAIALAIKNSRAEMADDRKAPMVGIVATVIFATQMINFPVGAGTSGHLLGGALAAVLLGPWTAVLALSAVFIVQALLFADGGLTALGTNITLMGLVTITVGWWVFRGLVRVLPAHRWAIAVAAGIGGLLSVPASAIAFVGLFAIGGQVAVPIEAVFAAMVGWHALIGIGEAIITGLIVAAVLATRPDLVYGARFQRSGATPTREAALV